MKKVIYLSFVILLALFACKKKVEQPVAPPPPPPPPKISQVEYVKTIGNIPDVKNLAPGGSVTLSIDASKVESPTSTTAVVEKINPEPGYNELLNLLHHGYLTVVWGEPGWRSELLNLEDLVDNKSVYLDPKYADYKFHLLDPMPEYKVNIGKDLYWVTASGNLWKTF